MSAFCLSMFFFISSLTYSYFYLYSRMCSCKSVLSFLTFSISVFWSLSIFFAYSSLWCSYLRRYISALSLLGSYSSIILTFLSAIFLTLAKQLWEKRFPCKPISIKVVFLFSFSSIRASTDSLKKLSASFIWLISLLFWRALMRKKRPESFNLQEEKSNFLNLVAPVPCSPWMTIANTCRMSSPKKFLLQTRVSMFVEGNTSHSFLKPFGPISFRETSSSFRLGAYARL